MKKASEPDIDRPFIDEVRVLEERLYRGSFDDTDSKRMKHDGYSWHYRPSHHVKTGLITKADVSLLCQQDKRLLSIGAYPMYLEQLLCVLGVPAENIVVADIDPAIRHSEGVMPKAMFDATGIWPDIGTFDLIIFPESLCMAVRENAKAAAPVVDGDFSSDPREAELLASVLTQALKKLRPGGEIRANGPMSHPNVVKAAGEKLKNAGIKHVIDYDRFFLRVKAS